MLYDTNTPYSYKPQPSYLNAYDYAGGSSGYNRAGAMSSESVVSNTAGGILENIPVVSSFYKLGNSAYKGLKSTDSAAGDLFGTAFAPHHQWFANLDDSIKLNKRKKRMDFTTDGSGKMVYSGNQAVYNDYKKDKQRNVQQGLLSIFENFLGASIASIGQGKADRADEQQLVDYNKKLQNYYQQGTGVAIPSYQAKDATPYSGDITQGLTSGVMGLFSQYGNKKADKPTAESQPSLYQGLQGVDTSNMVYDPEMKVNTTDSNMQYKGYKKGGAVEVEGGNGDDDIALVDTTNGKDTGVRVEKGEMLVISKDNVEAIEQALESGDKESIYNILRKQFKESPTEKYHGGGQGRTDGRHKHSTTMDNYITPYNEQTALDAIYGNDKSVDTEHPSIAQSLYESETPSFYDRLKGIDFNSYAGNAYDAFRFGLGASQSMKELPRWTLPTDYLQYGEKLKSESTRGLAPEELALLNRNADENLRYGMENIYNLAGGNSGMALANINNLGANRLDDAIKIATLNKSQERTNVSNYGAYLKDRNAYDRQQFIDQLTQDEKTKGAAAQLTQDAYHNIQDRNDYNKTYGKGSQYDELQKLYTRQRQLELEMKQNYSNNFIR